MKIDLTKLSPDQFYAGVSGLHGSGRHVLDSPSPKGGVAEFQIKEDAEFHLLARKAFEVMMLRGWHARAIKTRGGTMLWEVANVEDGPLEIILSMEQRRFDDPFTVVVEVDKWMTAHEAKHRRSANFSTAARQNAATACSSHDVRSPRRA